MRFRNAYEVLMTSLIKVSVDKGWNIAIIYEIIKFFVDTICYCPVGMILHAFRRVIIRINKGVE